MHLYSFLQTKNGMIHISKLSNERVEKVEDVVNIGDKVAVKVLEDRQDGKNQSEIRRKD